MAVYAVSDLHGRDEAFREGLERIGFGDADQLYVIGDAIDRGDGGIRILQEIKERENMDLIIGNHEFMMLNSVDPYGSVDLGRDSTLWMYYNGGHHTYDPYIELSRQERKELYQWLADRYVIKTVTVGERTFCLTHSNYDPAFENKRYSEMEYRDVWDMVWKSVYREEPETHAQDIYPEYPQYTFLTGHVPVMRAKQTLGLPEEDFSILERGNLVNLDGGCAFGPDRGILCGALFLRLDDWECFPVPLRK